MKYLQFLVKLRMEAKLRELSKSIPRRIHDPYFMNKYFVGKGVDIGGFPDPLLLYVDVFPLLESVQTWDWEQGDAQFMGSVLDGNFDFVNSSHCLEHLVDPYEGLKNWLRIVKPNGHLVVVVPEEDLYEQGVFPSSLNKDHKWTFTINKKNSWSKKSISVLDLVESLGEAAELVRIQKLDIFNHYEWPRFDQTRMPNSESAIEFVIRKRRIAEMSENINGSPKDERVSFPAEKIPYLNQYKSDQDSLRRQNQSSIPFGNLENPSEG